jgi:hypothetical protein
MIFRTQINHILVLWSPSDRFALKFAAVDGIAKPVLVLDSETCLDSQDLIWFCPYKTIHSDALIMLSSVRMTQGQQKSGHMWQDLCLFSYSHLAAWLTDIPCTFPSRHNLSEIGRQFFPKMKTTSFHFCSLGAI